jgi:PAS domain S-box-containing protein
MMRQDGVDGEHLLPLWYYFLVVSMLGVIYHFLFKFLGSQTVRSSLNNATSSVSVHCLSDQPYFLHSLSDNNRWLIASEFARAIVSALMVNLTYLHLGSSPYVYLYSLYFQCNAGLSVSLVTSNSIISFLVLASNAVITLAGMWFFEVKRDVIIAAMTIMLIIILNNISSFSFMKQLLSFEKTCERNQAILKRDRLYRKLFDEAPFLFISVSNTGKVLTCNAAISKLLGTKINENIDVGIEVLFLPECKEAVRSIFDSRWNDVDPPPMDLFMKSVDGTIHHMRASIALTRDSYESGSAFAIMVLFDMTEKEILEVQKQEVKNREEEASRSKSTFLNHMSHKIRTPLCSILANIELLLTSDELNDTLKEILRHVEMSAVLLRNLIFNVLDMAKIEAGRLRLDASEFNLMDSMDPIIDLMSENAKEKLLEFHVHVSESLKNANFIGDSLRLDQILVNLIDNAIKFTNKGQVTLSVDISPNFLPYRCLKECIEEFDRKHKIESEQERLIFLVQDTGIGIPKDKFDNIFQQFYQITNDLVCENEGTGLGLAISKSLIQMMKGDVFVYSEENKGSCFCFTVILNKVSSAQVSLCSLKESDHKSLSKHNTNRSKEIGNNKDLEVPQDAQDIWVLVAEDNLVNQKLLQHILKRYNIGHVDFADNGQILVDLFKQSIRKGQRYDLIFCDIQMPILNGYEATKEIRKIDSDIPIIGLSADASSFARYASIEAGMTAFCAKPFTMKQIASFLKKRTPNSKYSTQS